MIITMSMKAAHRTDSFFCRSLAGDENFEAFDIGWKIFPHPVQSEESTIGMRLSQHMHAQ